MQNHDNETIQRAMRRAYGRAATDRALHMAARACGRDVSQARAAATS